MHLDADGDVGVAYPFSRRPSGHLVQLDRGPAVWAMCAIDALGIPVMTGRDAAIVSADPAAMSLIADELMTPAAGCSAPNRAYPLVTHLRGFAAHLAFGLAVAGVTEAAWLLRGRRP